MKYKFLTALWFLSSVWLYANTEREVIFDRWLITEPVSVVYPLFYELENVVGSSFSPEDLLKYRHLRVDSLYPAAGDQLQWVDGQTFSWTEAAVNTEDQLALPVDSPVSLPHFSYLATYITVDRWMEGTIEIKTPQMATVYLNGEQLGHKTSFEGGESAPGTFRRNVKLERGKHRIMIKSLYAPDKELSQWTVKATFKHKKDTCQAVTEVSTSPKRSKTIHDILNGVKVSWLRPSPCGDYYAVAYRESSPPKGATESWIDIKKTNNHTLIHSFRHTSIRGFQWLPKSHAVSYVKQSGNKTDLYRHDLKKGQVELLLEDVERFHSYQWNKKEDFIVYTAREDHSDDPEHIRHIIGMRDRQDHSRMRAFLYYLDVQSKATYRLTYGALSTRLHDISPCGEHILFSHTWPEYEQRPYSMHNIYLMNLPNMTVDTLFAQKKWPVNGLFSPQGNHILFTGGPDAFDQAGKNIPEHMLANNYDTQAYLYHLQNKTITPLTRDFDPSITSANWSPHDGNIYWTAQDKEKISLYRYNLQREQITQLSAPGDIVAGVQLAGNAPIATAMVQGTTMPFAGYKINLRRDRWTRLEDTESSNYRHVSFGEVKEWNHTTKDGVHVAGRVYLPPQFHKDSTYPAIVYYYGGTNPVSRRFGGRYPFNLWAGQGYVVYVLQPSGTTGFGQEFSAAHVNNWGKTVAGEIIECTKAFMRAHPFVDSTKIGCAGASYGGFMTMLLITETDLFATAISHAGISSISSYWGEGYWGYAYSAHATANKYPWDSPEIYIEQSPLFRADKVNTPLLLVTGDSDTNVPPGESIQMYTALKILGKPVELLKVKGQDHHIINYQRRIHWNNAIIAWFDKWLKEQDNWWEEQFPKKNF